MNKSYWEKLQELFHQAQKLAPEEIEKFLEVNCGNNKKLKDELFAILKINTQGGNQLTNQVIGAARELTKDSNIKGTRVGVYEIISEIGKGGMGTVYLAKRADNSYQQKVAIKLISNHQNTHEITKRFIAERQILAQLTHTNIARLLDGGTTKSGEPYFAMEYIKGLDILQYCDSQKLIIKKRLKLFLSVSSAISHAHGKFVLHRDIKPSNILVAENGIPKLLDFGIAKLLDIEGQNPSITGFDYMMLTPEYASPEQVLGQPMGVASDIYQLGLVLYQLLTGEKAQKIIHNFYVEVKQSIVDNKPLSPSGQISTSRNTNQKVSQKIAANRGTIPDKLFNSLKGDLDTIVLKCLNKDPEQRYQSVKELSDDIEAYLELRPIKARGLSTAYRFKRFIHRHWIGVMATTVTISALVLGLFFSLFSLNQAKEAEQKAEIEAQTAKQVSQFLVDMISKADPRESGNKSLTVKTLLNKSLTDIYELNEQPKVQIKLLNTIGGAFSGLGEYKQGLAVLQKAIDNNTGRNNVNTSLLIESITSISGLYDAQGQYKKALIYAKKAEKLATEKKLLNADILAQLSICLFNNNKFDESKEKALESLELFHSENLKTKITMLDHIGLIAFQEANFVVADKYFLRAQNLIKDKFQYNYNKLQILLHRSKVKIIENDLQIAEDLLNEAYRISKILYGKQHIDIIRILRDLASLQIRKNNLIVAKENIDKAFMIADSLLGKNSTEKIRLYDTMGLLYNKQQRFLKALSAYKESSRISQLNLGGESQEFLVSFAFQVTSLMPLGRYKEVLNVINKVELALSSTVSDTHPVMLKIRLFKVQSLIKLGKLKQAASIAEKIIEDSHKAPAKGKYIEYRAYITLFDKDFIQGNAEKLETDMKTIKNLNLGRDKSDDENILLNITLAKFYSFKKDYLKALEFQQKAIDTLSKNSQEALPENQYNLVVKAKILSKLQKHSDAISIAEMAYNQWLKYIDLKENKTGLLALEYVEVLLNAKKASKAIDLLNQHIPTLEKAYGNNHYQLNRARCLKGRALMQSGDVTNGNRMIKQALSKLKMTLESSSPLIQNCRN